MMGDLLPVEAEQESTQPELFGAGEIELRFVEGVKHYVHTGARLANDPVECEHIVRDLLSNVPLRVVAKRYGRSHHTIRQVLEILEGSGKLATFKERLSRDLKYAAKLGVDESMRLLQEGKIQGNVLPVMVGVYLDKIANLDGDATMVVEHRKAVSEEDVIKGMEAWAAKVKRVQGSDQTVIPPGAPAAIEEGKPCI